jgi:hypothetical protein
MMSVSQLWREGKAAIRVEFPFWHLHILFMTQWQRTFTREPPKTKAELREMLTEAVRNTQPELKRPPPQAKRDRG